MSLRLSKYLLGIFLAASFAIGTVASPVITAALPPLTTDHRGNDSTEKLSSEINDEIAKINEEINKLKNRPDQAPPQVTEEIANLEKQLQIAAVKLDRLGNVSDDIDELKKDVADLKTSQMRSLTASVDKLEYRAGDSLIVNGIGLPNRSASYQLIDSDRLALIQGSTLSDSNGKFTFTIQLSKSLAAGTYAVKLSQEDKTVEKSFTIIASETSSSQSSPSSSITGFTISVDRSQYARGDTVVISGRTDSNVFIDLDVFDSSNVQLVRTATKSDASGNYRLEYTIPSNAATGNYEVKGTVGSKQTTVKFSVVSSTSTTSTSSSSAGSLTITTDKTSYQRGDLVKITGKAPANSKVTITAEPPFGDKLLMTPTATDTGNYVTLLSIDNSATTGTWKLTVKQNENTATTQITVF
ncbi:MAG: hypothetical protein ACRD32_05280 [Nitrososphaerales archaeon]